MDNANKYSECCIFTAYSPVLYHCKVNVDGMAIVWWRLRKMGVRKRKDRAREWAREKRAQGHLSIIEQFCHWAENTPII